LLGVLGAGARLVGVSKADRVNKGDTVVQSEPNQQAPAPAEPVPDAPAEPVPDAPARIVRRTTTVPVVSLPVELIKASLGALGVGLSAFVSNLALTNASDIKALESAGLAAGLIAATFFSNSFNNWYQQRYGS
jgi:hypothetical protein